MRHTRSLTVTAFLAFGLTACGTGKTDTAAADSAMLRDQTLLPADSTLPLGDTAMAMAPTPAPTPVAARPVAPRPVTRNPVAPRPATPAPAPRAASRSLDAGTTVFASSTSRITSRTNRAGEEFEVRVSRDVNDSRGRTVIPAGSTVTLSIVRIKESENKSDNVGTLQLAVKNVIIEGQSYPISASVASQETVLEGRKTNVGDVAKVGAGAGAGAVVGKVLGGGRGALIGGAVGAAVGTQRAVETKDRDIVLNDGAGVTITLDADFARS